MDTTGSILFHPLFYNPNNGTTFHPIPSHSTNPNIPFKYSTESSILVEVRLEHPIILLPMSDTKLKKWYALTQIEK